MDCYGAIKGKCANQKGEYRKSYAQAGQEMEEEKISKILEQNLDIQTCYDQWKQAVGRIVDKNMTRVKKKNPRKAIRLLVRDKKHTKKLVRKATPERRQNMKSRNFGPKKSDKSKISRVAVPRFK